MTPHPTDVTVLGLGGMGSALAGAARDVDARHYPGDVGNLAVEATGIGHIIDAVVARGLDASVLRSVKALADRAVARGHGGDDFSRLVEVIRPG
ncbi:hypothetical protein H7827_15205 [Streptomyces sp. JH002]|uniref:imine reductase family protein n=1 Tax=Streptomyces sp. JH002 TaxID=2763259 RepID=UPI003D801C93